MRKIVYLWFWLILTCEGALAQSSDFVLVDDFEDGNFQSNGAVQVRIFL